MIAIGKCTLTASDGVTHNGQVTETRVKDYGSVRYSEITVVVYHDPKPEPEPEPPAPKPSTGTQRPCGVEWERDGNTLRATVKTPEPSPRKHALTPHGRQCVAREALVAAHAAESDAVRDAMIDLALRLLGGVDEQP